MQVANYTGPKFEFDENQEAAAAAESDWGSADGDFVGRNNSEAGTSDGDTVQPGEFDGTNTWKPGSKGTRKSPSKAAARSASRTPATPKAKASKPIASKTNSSRKGKQTPNRSTPKTQSGSSMSPATPATPKSRAQTPQPSQSSGRRQPKTPTKKMPSLNKNPTKGVGRAKAQVQRANKLPLRPLELELQEQGKQPGDGPTAPGQGTAQQEQQHQQHQQHQQENQFSEDSTQPKTSQPGTHCPEDALPGPPTRM